MSKFEVQGAHLLRVKDPSCPVKFAGAEEL